MPRFFRSYLYNSLLIDDRNLQQQQQRPYSTPSALMSEDRKDGDQQSGYPMYPPKTDGSLYSVNNTVTVTCSPSTAGNPYNPVDHSTEQSDLATLERLTNIERTIEAVSKAEQFSESSFHSTSHQNGNGATHHDGLFFI